MESKIIKYLKNLDFKALGFNTNFKITKVEKLGLGESNLNYLVYTSEKKLIFRINMDLRILEKTEREFNSLTQVSSDITPKAIHYENSVEFLGAPFIILEYFEGISLDNIENKDKYLIKLADLVGKLHSTKIELKIQKKMRKYRLTELVDRIEYRLEYIKKKMQNTSNPLVEMLEAAYLNINDNIQIYPKQLELVLGHGDLAPKNVILHADELKLIDWEDLGLYDPALELSILFDSFDLTIEQGDLFIKQYQKINDVADLKKKMNLIYPIHLFRTFCWALMHIFEIRDKEMHNQFLKDKNLDEHIEYAQKMLKKCLCVGIIKGINSEIIESLFKD